MAFTRRYSHGRDRGSAVHGAKRFLVTPDLQLLDHALAKQHGVVGTFFQSGAEAKRWIGLHMLLRAGQIRNLRRQVRYALHVTRPDGLKEKIGTWAADFVYEERTPVGPQDAAMWIGERTGARSDGAGYAWVEIIEDVKGHPTDLFLWKKAHFQSEHGKQITVFKAGSRR